MGWRYGGNWGWRVVGLFVFYVNFGIRDGGGTLGFDDSIGVSEGVVV